MYCLFRVEAKVRPKLINHARAVEDARTQCPRAEYAALAVNAVPNGQLVGVRAEVARMENLTKRLSDDYLDVDLLDEQARSILGVIRADEIVIR